MLDQIRSRSGSGRYRPSLGDIIEVYWVDENKWFEGEVVDTRGGGEYRVHYVLDGEKH